MGMGMANLRARLSRPSAPPVNAARHAPAAKRTNSGGNGGISRPVGADRPTDEAIRVPFASKRVLTGREQARISPSSRRGRRPVGRFRQRLLLFRDKPDAPAWIISGQVGGLKRMERPVDGLRENVSEGVDRESGDP